MEKLRTDKMITFGFFTALWLLPLTVNAADDGSDNQIKAINYNEMVNVPAGKFITGKIYAKKEIDLPAFKIDKYEVTNAQYAEVVKDFKLEPGEEHLPVVLVSQDEAWAYCKAVGKILPSEEQWEKAARGTDGRLYPWGFDFDESAAVTSETANGKAAPVGSREKGQSPYGAMDMAGNVWEWTTGYDGRYSILKGGSFYEASWAAQVTSTLDSIPEDGKTYVGFRCAKDGK